MKILRVKWNSPEYEGTLDHIEHENRLARNLHPRQSKQQD